MMPHNYMHIWFRNITTLHVAQVQYGMLTCYIRPSVCSVSVIIAFRKEIKHRQIKAPLFSPVKFGLVQFTVTLFRSKANLLL